MITATKPTSPLFTSSLDTFTFKISGDTATVTIKCNGMELLSETYYPVSGSITIYDLGTHTVMAAVNYMAKKGWILDKTYYVTEGAGRAVLHYVLVKRVKNDSEIREGLITKDEQ